MNGGKVEVVLGDTLAERIHGVCEAVPANGSFALADQLRRVAVSTFGEIATAGALWPGAERRLHSLRHGAGP